jgi:SAM-dependent methyltransferase
MSKTLPEHQLKAIEQTTVGHYDDKAESFWQGTKDHDVLQNYENFLRHLPDNQSLDILDFGCGPGRDIKYFKTRGHRPVGLDGSRNFCDMARAYSGCPVLHQSFLNLDLPEQSFDGVFANASLFHVPGCELPRVLAELNAALRVKGILFTSNPRGSGEGWSGQRYGHFLEFEATRTYLEAAGFEVLDHYYRPAGQPRSQQPWLAIVSQKTG